MSSPLRAQELTAALQHAARLKRDLSEFVTSGPLKEVYEQHRSLYPRLRTIGGRDELSVFDWFLFDWTGEDGEGAIDQFLDTRPGLSEADQKTLLDWEDSVNSVFCISSIEKTAVELVELETEELFSVATARLVDPVHFRPGLFIATRLLPLGDQFIFSGPQYVITVAAAAKRAYHEIHLLDVPESPQSMEESLERLRDAFVEFFGTDEASIPAAEFAVTLERFRGFLVSNHGDEHRFGNAFAGALKIPALNSDALGELTLLCDEFEGILLLPEYNRFKQIFQVADPEAHEPEWRELVWDYIKNPQIPILAFQRIAENQPERVEQIFRSLLDEDRDFRLDHLYAVLLHYKEPVEGFEDIKDEERLWDILDGNGAGSHGSKRSAAKSAQARGAARPASSAPKSPGNRISSRKAGSLPDTVRDVPSGGGVKTAAEKQLKTNTARTAKREAGRSNATATRASRAKADKSVKGPAKKKSATRTNRIASKKR